MPRPESGRSPRARFALFALVAACARTPSPAPAARELAIDVSGCLAWSDARVCTLDRDASMRVLVHSTAPVTVEPASVALERVTAFDDAALYRLTFPAGASRARLVAHAAEGDARAEVSVDARALPLWVERGRALAAAGESDAAAALYDEHRAAIDPAERAIAAGQTARVALARGDVDASAAAFRDAIALDRVAGRISDAVDDTLALAFALSARSHRYGEARAALESVASLASGYADGLARAPYYWGYLHSEAGDRRAALRELREAEQRATRLGLTRLARNARTMTAVQLELVGRLDESIAARRAIDREPDLEPCERVALRGGIGFALSLAVVQHDDRARLAEARANLASARADEACREPFVRAVVLGNDAFAALLDGRVDEARTSLDAACALAPDPTLTEGFFRLDLEGRIALTRGAGARALAIYDEMDRRARAAVAKDYEWAAQVGRGAALEALGRVGGALEAYARAEDLLGEDSLAIPLGEGRGRFLVERGRGASAAIERLVASGRSAEALRWARRARGRTLATVEIASRLDRLSSAARAQWDDAVARYAQERSALDADAAGDWKLLDAELGPAREARAGRERALKGALEAMLGALAIDPRAASSPRPLAPGELLLLYAPSHGGWTGFAADVSSTVAFAVPRFDVGAPADEVARRLLAPAGARIDHASRLRVLLPGDLAAIDVHALPWHGDPLVARLPVEYSLDLADAAPSTKAERALVVGDPQENLPEARREARAVADALGRVDAPHVVLLTERAATHDAVIASLDGASRFHYAGHASYGGEDGWDSALPLAGGGRLLVSDVVALARPPAHVVLTGCSAARSSSDAPGDTLGVAQAFLVAGSHSVIAPTRNVSDALSAHFADALYAAYREAADLDEARALRIAALRVRGDDPRADWASFRVLRR